MTNIFVSECHSNEILFLGLRTITYQNFITWWKEVDLNLQLYSSQLFINSKTAKELV